MQSDTSSQGVSGLKLFLSSAGSSLPKLCTAGLTLLVKYLPRCLSVMGEAQHATSVPLAAVLTLDEGSASVGAAGTLPRLAPQAEHWFGAFPSPREPHSHTRAVFMVSRESPCPVLKLGWEYEHLDVLAELSLITLFFCSFR